MIDNIILCNFYINLVTRIDQYIVFTKETMNYELPTTISIQIYGRGNKFNKLFTKMKILSFLFLLHRIRTYSIF